ncbi:hypothetical protein [Agrobacterium vitis]|uniref:hypothetical protein n=1 Tax=Agrobacterium vitis TaxID=373 RepID=UPI0012E76754|nr:hypothetical protein [Agrobacterium vitis]MVA54236.1 hypothetical protein [Agrobacterium vitis]NSZ53754.1 hypothetical protein [Agrobacterium vitis]NTA32513.1 hypothetical protein [Agrobacterium vitis]
MNSNRMVLDHLKAALVAAGPGRPFLTYLIQMALMECCAVAQTFHLHASRADSDSEHSDVNETSGLLSQLPLPKTRTGVN